MNKNSGLEKTKDEDLIPLILKNRDFFAILMERYEQKLTRYIKKISGLNTQDTEDILQDIFLKVYQNLNDFDPSLKFSSWIYRISHNEIISHWRKSKTRPQFVGGDEIDNFLHNIASKLDIHKDLQDKSLQDDIKKVLAKMDLKYREVLVLKFLEEQSYEEISDILKKPMGTVATLINRAKKQFKKEASKANIQF